MMYVELVIAILAGLRATQVPDNDQQLIPEGLDDQPDDPNVSGHSKRYKQLSECMLIQVHVQ